ncbi:hypothetical protein [Arcobacter sp.]|uniref:hypothetical protein n=1 Tax=Arcobacter sp. TaxID=1872629 RepID=UPI003D1356FC
MKKLTTLIVTASIAAVISGCTSQPSVATAAKLDLNQVCSVEKSGINSVITTAAEYNAIAKAEGVEFMRLGMTASQYVEAVQAGIKSGAKTIEIVDKKKKVTGTMDITEAAQRACRFAVVALQQKDEAKTFWKQSMPGVGIKY